MENTFPSDDDDDHHRLLLIPGDVLIQILVWLPAISLLRFKSVCKSWHALIKTSFFIHLHATVTPSSSSSSSKFGTLIFQTLQSVVKFDNGNGEEEEVVVFEVEDLGFPPLYKIVPASIRHDLRIVCSCNGIVCLYDDSKLRDISLWNPATRQFKLLPKSLTFQKEEEDKICIHIRNVVAFGFDVKTNDYKVVQITHFALLRQQRYMNEEEDHWLSKKLEYVLRVQVYSLSSNSWRLLEGDGGINSLVAKPVKGLNINTHGLYLNGSYFFGMNFVRDGIVRHRILSFDLTKEIFTTVQFQDELDPKYILILTYFGDKIAIFVRVEESWSSSSRGGGGGECYDIWVLNEHNQEEEEESYYWTKLQHSIRIRERKEVKWDTIIPLGISKDGEFALIETRGGNGAKDWKLQLFNLATKEKKTVFPTSLGWKKVYVHKPSLVSIIGGNDNDNDNCNGTATAAAADRVVQCEHLLKPYWGGAM